MLTHKKPRFFSKIFHGFTLVELIVVISVLAVLASIAMSQVSNITAGARDSQRMTDMSSMKSSIELYKAKTGKLPTPTNGSGVTYSGGLLWTQGTFGESVTREIKSITPKPIDPINKIEYVYSVANNNREFELGGILEKATGLAPSLFPELLAASQNVTFIEGTYNGVSLKVETGSKTYVVAAPSLIGGYLGDTKMENTGLTIEGLGSLPLGFSGAVISTAQTGTFTPVIGWSGTTLPTTSTGAEAMIVGLQTAYSGSFATNLSQISSLVSATGTQITSLGAGLVENSLGGKITGESSSGGGGSIYCSNPTVVTTIAGDGTDGFVDGPGTSAQFKYPFGVAVDANGNVYVADATNHRVRKITSAGVVSTLAGDGTAGFADGPGTSAQFNNPDGVSVDTFGNVYVGDTANNRIRKITPAGVVTTLAGDGTAGFADGPGTSAQFKSPVGLAVDTSGNIYVADYMNQRIRKITSAGVVSTLAGDGTAGFADGPGTSAQFKNPQGLAVDTSGNIYVADATNHRVRKITSAGTVSTLAGNGTAGFADGAGTSAQFNNPYGVALDTSGNIYVADATNHRIRKITSAGVVSTLAGDGTAGFADGPGTSAQFKYPFGVAVDAGGNVYTADMNNKRIRKISCQ